MFSKNEIKSFLRLYAITDSHWVLEKCTLQEQVEQALSCGVTVLQYREKNLSFDLMKRQALDIKFLCRKYNVPFIVNDDPILAKELDADGVHVGQDDMPLQEVRKILGNEKIIGVSAHNVAEALNAWKNGADYLGCGAVFPTESKKNVNVLSKNTLFEICKNVPLPVVAIGGISAENLLELKGTGISGAAVISAVFGQKDIKAAVEKLKNSLQEVIGR